MREEEAAVGQGFGAWWVEHEPREKHLDDWTHDDLRDFALKAYKAGLQGLPVA